MSSLGTEFPKEQKRVRELLEIYKEIPTGAFGAMMIKQALDEAEEAAISGDVVRMLKAYERLKGCE